MHTLIKCLYIYNIFKVYIIFITLFTKGCILVLHSCCYDLAVNDKNLCFYFFLSFITIFYLIEADICINPKGFIPGRRLAVRLGSRGLFGFILTVFSILFLRKSRFSNQTRGGNITMLHVIKSWYVCKGATALDKSLD